MADERKLATILFADLAGSTALAHEQDPERTCAGSSGAGAQQGPGGATAARPATKNG